MMVGSFRRGGSGSVGCRQRGAGWWLAGPAAGGEDGVLDVGVEVEGVDPAFAADPGLAVAAERCAKVADEEAVHPDGAGVQLGADPFGAVGIARDEGGG